MIWNFRHSIFLYLLLLFLSFTNEVNAQGKHLQFDQLTVNDGLPQNSVYSIAQDKYGFMWFGTWGGAVRYDGYKMKVFRAHGNDTTSFSDNRISAIFSDSLQNIWIEVEPREFLFKYNYETETFSRFPKDQVPYDVSKKLKERYGSNEKQEENQTYRWITSPNGLVQINRKTGDTTIYRADSNDPLSISGNWVKYIYLDDSEHLWVGTQSVGVNYADLYTKPFVNYYKGQNGDRLIDNAVRAVCKDHQGRIWVGSENQGITIIAPSQDGPEYFYIGEEKIQNLQIRALYCDSQGIVWIGTKRGLYYYDPEEDSFTQCSKATCNLGIFSITEDQNGNLWVGTFYALALYDKQNDRFHCYDNNLGLAGSQIMDLMVDHANNLWIATEDGGLSRLKPDEGSIESGVFDITNYTYTTGTEKGLLSNRTYSLAEDQEGQIWIATTEGLSRLNPKTNTFQHFTEQNGLTDELTMAVAFDGKESVWVSHTKGLSRVNTLTGELQNFNMKDGLQGNEFKQNATYHHTESGRLFFGGSNGLTSFDPDQINTNPYPPQMVLTKLNIMHQDVQRGTMVNDRKILENSLLTTDKITLTWWDKTFRVEFAALHFTNPLSNKYKYKLEGYDKDWIFTDASRRMASYANLPAGNYTFKVFGANSDGVWSNRPAVLQIEVLPPWWLSWWAICLYALATGTLIWFIYRYLISKIQLRKKEAIHQAKLDFFTQVSHEFRTPLTLIIDPLERLMAEKPKKRIAEHYYQLMHSNAKQLLLLINQLLDFRKLESGHFRLDLQQSDIVAFVRSLAASFEEMAKNRHIDFKVEASMDQYHLSFDDAKMTMVLNNLLSNAFKFTPENGKITLAINYASKPKNGILIKVQDTGKGISKEEQEKIFGVFYQASNNNDQHKGSGIGLSLTKELVDLHDGKLTVESEIGKGSCFTIFLPTQENVKKTNPANAPQTPPMESDSKPIEKSTPQTSSSDDVPLILVVDDHPDIRAYVELSFSKDYRIITANNGLEGLEKAIEKIPDLVISDVMMPDMDGLQLCKKMKTDERTSHIPIILLTARQSDESQTEGYETGADAYVTKPFNTTVLRAQVQNLLEQRHRLRELFSKGSEMEFQKIAVNAADESFLANTKKLIEANLETEKLDIDSLAGQLNMSRSQFYRKIKALTNKSASDFVTTIRMNKAAEFLLSGQYNVTETAYKVGYSVPNNFTRAFIKYFGTSPSQYTGSKTEK